jgi:probable F420-dependent oxidoreductase
VKFGIMFANTMSYVDPVPARALAEGAEAAGFESLWTVEHVVYPDGYQSTYPYSPKGKMPGDRDTPIPDPLIWLSYVAACSTSLVLATGILILPQRNPLVLAKELATLDRLSGGRMLLGIGVGWLREEFEALGVPWERRGERTDDYVAAMRAVWDSDGASHAGPFASFSGISSNPKPVGGSVPIVIGGHTRAAAERAGRLGDGFFPGSGNLAELFDIVRQTAVAAGRDPGAVELTAGHADLFGDDPAAAVQELDALGVGRAVVPAFRFSGPDPADSLAAFGEQVIGPVAT